MANFFQNIIDKITGHTEGSQPAPTPVAPLDISHVGMAVAVNADASAQAAKDQADKAEVASVTAAAPDPATSQQLALTAVQAQQQRDAQAQDAAQQVAAAAEQFEIIKEHTLTDDDMLGALALHFYGHATPPYWGLIILANKNTIGDKVSDYTPGKVIKIPVLPDSMKK